jgi:hypothetical protein
VGSNVGEEVKAAAVIKKGTKAMKHNCETQKAHADWVAAGWPVDEDGNPHLIKKDSHAIVKFILWRLDTKGELKLKDFSLMKAGMR